MIWLRVKSTSPTPHPVAFEPYHQSFFSDAANFTFIDRRLSSYLLAEILDIDGDDLSITITKWLDLGLGLTPMDLKWRVLTGFADVDDESDHASEAERCRVDWALRK